KPGPVAAAAYLIFRACPETGKILSARNVALTSFGGFRQVWAAEGILDALGAGGADALGNRERLLQVRGGLGGVAFSKVAVADAFQGPRFLRRRADVAGDGQRLGVLVAGLAGGRGAERELAEAVQRLGLAEQVAEVTEQRQGLLVAGGG